MTGVDPVFAGVTRLGLAILFATAALHKARDLAAFRDSVRDYRIAPPKLAPTLASVLVGLESALVVLLLTLVFDPLGALVGLTLLGVYSAAIALNLARGRRHIDCGCLGPAHRQPLSTWILARNALLALGPLVLLMPVAPRAGSWVDEISVCGGVGVLVLIWNAAHQLGSAQSALRAPGRSP